jgi:hypothetical protein
MTLPVDWYSATSACTLCSSSMELYSDLDLASFQSRLSLYNLNFSLTSLLCSNAQMVMGTAKCESDWRGLLLSAGRSLLHRISPAARTGAIYGVH